MMTFLALACIAAALILLGALCVIDLKHRLLPDKLVLPFLILGVAFHFLTRFHYATPMDMVAGALLGGGLLYAVRFFAVRYYGDDALGLGDVKLMIAAGVWLGPQAILLTLIVGAMAGIFHGLAIACSNKIKTKAPMNLKNLSLPAGPGFAVGIVIAGIVKFYGLLDI